jgi:ribose 5-phosphate isomerase B
MINIVLKSNHLKGKIMKIIIGGDHSSVSLKQRIIDNLENKGNSVKNIGTDTGDSVDYPDIAEKACLEFLKGGYDFGILICGTGIGISISANKIKGIRCALLKDKFSAEMAKAHNNANFIAFGARIEYSDSVEDMIDTFIKTDFEGGRHSKRVNKIMGLE